MLDLYERIAQADELVMENLFKAVLKRHAILFPDVELHIISLRKNSNRDEQIDRMIELLQNMKNFS